LKIISSTDAWDFSDPVVFSLGMFDGVHLGHREIINKLLLFARREHRPSVLLTFNPHPRQFLSGACHWKYLTSLSEKADHLSNLGVDYMIVQSFDEAFASLSPEHFVGDILIKKLNICSLIIGYDHHLGRDKKGSYTHLKTLSLDYGFILEQQPAYRLCHRAVSSTNIKKALSERQLTWANAALGRPYSFYGIVIHGNQLGRQLNFPTANLAISSEKFLPAKGVYAVKVFLEEKEFIGMLNIGNRPTINSKETRIEVHIFDFAKEIYGHTLQLQLIAPLRKEKKFSSLADLKNQLQKDKEITRKILHDLMISQKAIK